MMSPDRIKRFRQALARRGVELSTEEVERFNSPPPRPDAPLAELQAYDRLYIKFGEAVGIGEMGEDLLSPLADFCREIGLE